MIQFALCKILGSNPTTRFWMVLKSKSFVFCFGRIDNRACSTFFFPLLEKIGMLWNHAEDCYIAWMLCACIIVVVFFVLEYFWLLVCWCSFADLHLERPPLALKRRPRERKFFCRSLVFWVRSCHMTSPCGTLFLGVFKNLVLQFVQISCCCSEVLLQKYVGWLVWSNCMSNPWLLSVNYSTNIVLANGATSMQQQVSLFDLFVSSRDSCGKSSIPNL